VRCENNRAEVCQSQETGDGSIYVWSRTDCGEGSCQLSREAQPFPFCTIGKQPDARCALASESSLCEGNVLLGCHDGFLVSSTDCSGGPSEIISGPAAGTPAFCVTAHGSAFCAAEEQPNPLCAKDDGYGRACDGNDMLQCLDGYLMDRSTCPAPGTCATSVIVFCALAPAADCNPVQDGGSFCRDGAVEECYYGWITSERACDPGTTCQQTSKDTALCL
jgi:hypothetical protein